MPPSPTPTNTPDQDYYRQVLHDLIDMGTDLARQVHQQATRAAEAQTAALPPHPVPEPPDPTIAFDRIARAIRRSIALARHIAEARPARSAPHATIARRRILREVEDVIQRTATGARAESLHAEALDRLDGPDLADEIGHLPVATIVADICRDLGIAAKGGTRPWKRRTPDDIALLCARAAQLAEPDAPMAPGIGTNTLLPFLKPPGRRPP
jgi:hypothetical protein